MNNVLLTDTQDSKHRPAHNVAQNTPHRMRLACAGMHFYTTITAKNDDDVHASCSCEVGVFVSLLGCAGWCLGWRPGPLKRYRKRRLW